MVMAEINDGGPAFPQTVQAGPDESISYFGATLRDYFAAHEVMDPNESIGLALAERLAGRPNPAPRDITGNIKSGGDPVEVAVFWADAEAAYRYLRADAMLRARSQP